MYVVGISIHINVFASSFAAHHLLSTSIYYVNGQNRLRTTGACDKRTRLLTICGILVFNKFTWRALAATSEDKRRISVTSSRDARSD